MHLPSRQPTERDSKRSIRSALMDRASSNTTGGTRRERKNAISCSSRTARHAVRLRLPLTQVHIFPTQVAQPHYSTARRVNALVGRQDTVLACSQQRAACQRTPEFTR